MLSAEEFLARWQAAEEDRKAIARYLAFVEGAGLEEQDLYRQELLDLYRTCRLRGGEGAIVRFLTLFVALREDLGPAAAPSLELRPRRFKDYRCPLIEEYLGGRQGLAAEALRLDGALLSLRLGRHTADLVSADFADPEVIAGSGGRLQMLGAKRSQVEVAYRFYRLQLDAAGVAEARQEALLLPLSPPPEEAMPQGVSPHLSAYLEYRRALGLGSWRDQAFELRRFETWTTERYPELADGDGFLDTLLLGEEEVLSYRDYLAERDGMSERTQSFRLSHLRTYLRWLRKQGLAGYGVLRPLARVSRRTETPVTVWDPAMLRALRDAVRRRPPLVRCAIGLLVTTLCRGQELYDVKVDDLDLEGTQIRYEGKGRGSQERWVPLASTGLLADLRTYLAQRPSPERPCERALFLLPNGRPLTAADLRREFREVCKEAGIEGNWTPRVLRRTGATMLAQEGIDTLVRTRIMGHQDLRSQDYYVKNDFAKAAARLFAKAEAYEDPLADE